MSYILDALKKSEKERQKGTLPDMLTVQDLVAEKPKKRFIWAYFLAAALVLNAGIFAWWLGFSPAEKKKVVQVPTTARLSVSTGDVAVQSVAGTNNSPPLPAQTIIPEFKPAVKAPAPPVEKTASLNSDARFGQMKGDGEVSDGQKKVLSHQPVPATDKIKLSEPVPAKPVQAGEPLSLSSDPLIGPAEMPEENKVYRLKELPLSVRQNLPAFSISALMYSNTAASRMARINDQMMYEGQELIAGVRLEEITRDGVIFRHRKFRFYVGVK